MADDLDLVEEMLEAPYKKENDKTTSPSEVVKKEEKKKRSRSRSKERRRRSRSRSRDKRRRSRSRERSRHSRHSSSRHSGGSSRYGRRSRSRSRSPRGRHSRGGRSPIRRRSISPIRKSEPPEVITPEERDARTVFCMQLAARIRARDLEEFFSSVGKVRDVRLIADKNSRRSKGIAYIEFGEREAVPLAIGLSGQKLLGVPIMVQASQAEKNRLAQANQTLQRGAAGPMRLYVGSLHYNITEDMIKGIFEPFGKIENIQLIMDPESGRSKGYGFVTFHDSEDARRALEQLNGFELAGRPMKVGNVTSGADMNTPSSFLDSDELERSGIDLGTTGRLQLMAKLAEGTGFQVPQAAMQALNPLSGLPGVGLPSLAGGAMAAAAPVPGGPVNLQASLQAAQQQAQQAAAMAAQQTDGGASTSASEGPDATQCFLLTNMFDPTKETGTDWDAEIRDDIIEELSKHGGCVHVHVDKNGTQGNVYVKCPSTGTSKAAVTTLHGRWFAGKQITAAYVPLANYHAIFPASIHCTQPLTTATR